MFKDWIAVNQEEVRNLAKNETGKTLYTTKGRVFNYFLSIAEFGNFVPFKATHIANELGISRQSVYKSKKELLDDGLILNAVNNLTGEKGIVILGNIVQKGDDNQQHITVYK